MNKLRFIIGMMVLVSALLTFFHSIYWVFFSMFIGLNMMQFAFTAWCPLDMLIKRLEK